MTSPRFTTSIKKKKQYKIARLKGFGLEDSKKISCYSEERFTEVMRQLK